MVLVADDPDAYALSEEQKRRMRDACPDVEIDIHVLVPARLAGKDVPQMFQHTQIVPAAQVGNFDVEIISPELERVMRLLILSLCFQP